MCWMKCFIHSRRQKLSCGIQPSVQAVVAALHPIAPTTTIGSRHSSSAARVLACHAVGSHLRSNGMLGLSVFNCAHYTPRLHPVEGLCDSPCVDLVRSQGFNLWRWLFMTKTTAARDGDKLPKQCSSRHSLPWRVGFKRNRVIDTCLASVCAAVVLLSHIVVALWTLGARQQCQQRVKSRLMPLS